VQRRSAVHRTILAVDVEGFGDRNRTNPHQLEVRAGLYQALLRACEIAGIPWADCDHEDRGDGVLILAPPEVPKVAFVEALPDALVTTLREHNATHNTEERIRLRMALHAGEINYDDHGVAGAAVNLTFRLLDSDPLRKALAGSPGVLALVTSSWFYDEVVRHSLVIDHGAYRQIQVVVKETTTTGWISLPDNVYSQHRSRPSTSMMVAVIFGIVVMIAAAVLVKELFIDTPGTRAVSNGTTTESGTRQPNWPQLTFLEPSEGQRVAGTVTIRVKVSDSSKIREVTFHELTFRCPGGAKGGHKHFIGSTIAPGHQRCLLDQLQHRQFSERLPGIRRHRH
jgi:hypothetical protein